MVVSPARALGAPQTISLRPSLVSTWQTRSRSAFGCCAASTILATEKAASLVAGSSTCSTSSPAMVMASTTWSTVASVARCSLSQERVNFIASLSSAQAGGGVRRGEGGEAIGGEPARVGGEHVAQVGHAVLQHPQPVDAEAEGEALPDVGIEAAVLQHVGMDHPAADDLHPAVALADLHVAAGAVAAHVHLGAGLGEREVVRAEPGLDQRGLEVAGDELVARPLQMPH